MSKLTKLILRPKRFFQDSRGYRRLLLAALATRHATLDPTTSQLNLGTDTERDALLERLLVELGREVPAVDVTDGGRLTVAVLREHSHMLSSWLRRLHKRGLQVLVRGNAGRLNTSSQYETIDLAQASVFAVDDFIRLLNRFTVTIRTATGAVQVSIRMQIWEREEAQFVGPVRNRIARRVEFPTAEAHGFFETGSLPKVTELLNHPEATHVDFDIDVVFTWVNHRDPTWRRLWTETVGTEPEQEKDDTRGLDRYKNRDEMRFALRSIAQFAPWVRRIHIVTNCSPPDWLDTSHPKIRWVDHTEVLPPEGLPVFNSHAIESRLQHTPGLADHFLYFNDDFFLMRPIDPSHFFICTGMSRSFMEGHGSVHGAVSEESADYLNAARNGRRLLEETFQRSVTTLHKHTPYALRKDVLLEMEERFGGPIGQTSVSRFRSLTDISTVSFLYHHYAFLTARGIYAGSDATLIKPQTPNYPLKLHNLLQGFRTPVSLCLNDGGGSGESPYWDRYVVDFLEAYFPTPCDFERASS